MPEPSKMAPPRLATLVTLGTAAIVAATVLLLLGLINHYAIRYAGKEAGLRLQQLSWQMRDSLDRVVAQAAGDVQQLSELQQVREARAPAEVRAALDSLQKTFPDYAWIGMADNGGVVYAATGGMLEGANVSARPWFQKGKAGLRAADYHPAVLLGKLLPQSADPWRFVDVAAPVTQANGDARGVLGVHLSWDWARRLARTLITPALREYGAEIIVLRDDGTVLLGPQGMEEQKLATASLALALDGQTGFLQEVWPDGRRYVTGYSRTGRAQDLASLQWVVLVRQPEHAAMADWHKLERRILWLSLALGLALAGTAAWLARRLARPMNALSELMEARAAGAGGTAAADVPVLDGFREAGVLSRAMRHLLQAEEQHLSALQTMNEELEAKVAARTAELEAIAMRDMLTGLPNRRALMAALQAALNRSRRTGKACAVLFLDLDGFKGVNDTHGHDEGDELLRQVGARILACVRKTDMVARLAGDEFVVLLELLAYPPDAEETAAKIMPLLRAPYTLRTTEVALSASIGVALHQPHDTETLEGLLSRADHAMYGAKRQGKNCIALAPPAQP
ncbi:sensor domain-containing diguanylate cyclase [Pseudoduganella aquatica]|uniref:Diguanylate cyclase n=1 Tax=Pseudoduganella aquatica TaxID=2660641 RepID=A0A7X4HF42_9BURK|nr:sensor domain-containing diguanylate cyclase [Pseudoduganella aquatica]MYN10101.1 diguanylate cyclase [Pseudoduganella aquatica]